MAFKYGFESALDAVMKEIKQGADKQRKAAANHIKNKIKEKARARKVTGNLEKGAYAHNKGDASYVGFRAPAYQAYLLEFGHYAGSAKLADRKWVAPTPIVYPTFAEEAGEVERIMAEPWVK
jgi:hypothetical protein